jgi:hypothetical protein
MKKMKKKLSTNQRKAMATLKKVLDKWLTQEKDVVSTVSIGIQK